MSPTIFRWHGFRFSFFSNEEDRMHVHVDKGGCQAKIWIEPEISVAVNRGFDSTEMARVLAQVRENEDAIRDAWNRHFSR